MYIKTNTKLTKEIDGRTVQITLTVDGEQHADWSNRMSLSEKELKKLGYKIAENKY